MNYKSLPDSIFHMIQDDLFNRTVKFPRTNKPLCTGGESVDYRDFDDPVDVSANQEGVYDQPNFVIQLNLPSSEFPYNVEMGRGRSWGQLNDYLTQQYGLTDEECQRVWDEYRGTICKNAKLPSLNESRDKQQELIQYVITTLLKETIIDNNGGDYSFDWHPEPKKRKFYEAVLRDVVNDSIIEPDGVISVGDIKLSHQKGLLFHNLSHSYDVEPFLKHLRDTYGLVSHETHPIWTRWEHIMIDKIKKWLTDKGIKLNDAGYEEPLWYNNED